ncbi:MAG: hypothetical protein FWD87_08815 [Spirochaetaceae bacterium]|nr:hypothetical protein [Spirochaetaceae bacterium]
MEENTEADGFYRLENTNKNSIRAIKIVYTIFLSPLLILVTLLALFRLSLSSSIIVMLLLLVMAIGFATTLLWFLTVYYFDHLDKPGTEPKNNFFKMMRNLDKVCHSPKVAIFRIIVTAAFFILIILFLLKYYPYIQEYMRGLYS